jgi:hypothetical protein
MRKTIAAATAHKASAAAASIPQMRRRLIRTTLTIATPTKDHAAAWRWALTRD